MPRVPDFRRFVLLIVLLGFPILLDAQETVPQAVEPTPVVTAGPDEPTRAEAIRALTQRIQLLNGDIAEKKQVLDAAASAEEQNEIYAELQDLDRRVEEAKLRLLEIIATNVDLSGFDSVEEQPFTLQGAAEDILRPLVEDFKRFTAESREAQALREEFEVAKEKAELIRKALQALDAAVEKTTDPAQLAVLNNVHEEFSRRYEDVSSEVAVLGYQLDEINREKRSIVGETQGLITSFFRKRGRNLTIAFVVAFAVFAGLRFLHKYLHDHTRIFRKGRTFAPRVFDVALAIFTVVGALLGAVIVLLLAGDWVLLGLILLVLIVLVITAKDAVPKYMDAMRLLLNIGPVREGERIVFDGVPWLVDNLTFFTILRNPALRGGMVRMPIGRLTEMLSRPITEKEPYFPCEEGDWVLLDDGTYGRVVFQSVEMVRLILLGGAQKMYSTGAFLAQNPRNHSHGFRMTTTIGIDYKHQSESTARILEGLRDFFEKAVCELIDHKHIRSLKVEFAMANTSSLDYEVLLDVDGELAPKFNPISRALQRIGVDACNHFDLVIPFQQITLHEAGG